MQLLFNLTLGFGFLIPAVVIVGYRLRTLTRFHLLVFTIGTGLGFTWESGLNLAHMLAPESSIFTLHVSVPVPWVLHAVSFSLWDGLLFLIGVLILETVLSRPPFVRNQWRELGILVLWGQLQSIVVELTAIVAALWTYHPTWWNPGLVDLGEGTITLLPQLIWLLAIVAFYGLCFKLRRYLPREPTDNGNDSRRN